MSYNLFLDDERTPAEAYELTRHELLKTLDWVVVKDYEEFRDTLLTKGMPMRVSFDHDLKPEHYTPQEYWNDYDKSKEYQIERYKTFQHKTGKHCAELLKYACEFSDVVLPEYYCHSQNPVGKDWILEVLESQTYSDFISECKSLTDKILKDGYGVH